MSELLAPEIEVSERGEVTSFRLPSRQIKPWNLLGLLPLVFGLAFGGGSLIWGLSAINFARFDFFSLFFVAFAMPFVWSGLWLVRLGVLILAGHSEVQLRRDKLYAIERCGPFRWTRSLPLEVVRRFVVQCGAADTPRGSMTPAFLAELAAILVESKTEKKALLLTPAYPQQLLVPLAEELARRCNAAAEFQPVPSKPTVEVAQQLTPERPRPPVNLRQPDESDIEVAAAADGVTLTVPPAGVWAGSQGLLVFSLFWNGFMAVVTALMVFGGGGPKGKDLWLAGGFLGLFWAVGLGMLLGAINLGKRRAVLAVVGDRLLVMQTGLLGGKRQQWHKQDLIDIRVGPSGMEVNDVPVMELQFIPLRGSKFGMLSGRDTEELQWVADRLRQELQLQWTNEGEIPFREVATQPDTSAVVLDERADGLTLTVPPAGLFSGSKGLLTMALAWNGFVGLITAILVGVMFSGQKDVWIGLAFLSIFWLVGLALLLSAINMGTRRAVLAVVGDELLVLQTGIFGKKELRWQRADLADIRTGPSGMSVNNQPVPELQIHPKLGAKAGLLAGREHDELAWLATVLRRALHVPQEETAAK